MGTELWPSYQIKWSSVLALSMSVSRYHSALFLLSNNLKKLEYLFLYAFVSLTSKVERWRPFLIKFLMASKRLINCLFNIFSQISAVVKGSTFLYKIWWFILAKHHAQSIYTVYFLYFDVVVKIVFNLVSTAGSKINKDFKTDS